MKLGSAINSIEFSDTEQDRIGRALLKADTLQFNILHSRFRKINDNEFWRRAQKHLGITGFRIGTPAAQNMVLDRALNNLRRGHGPGYTDIWPLYRRCAVDYIINDLGNLNNLLLTEELVEGNGTLTEQIFRSIQSKSFFYGSSAEELRQLYDLWGFERVETFEKVLMDVGISGDLVRRLIVGEVEKLKKETRERLDLLKAEATVARADSKQQVAGLEEQLKGLREKLDTSLNKMRLEIADLPVPQISGLNITPTALDSDFGGKKVGIDEFLELQAELKQLVKTVGIQSDILQKINGQENESREIELKDLRVDSREFFNKWAMEFKACGYSGADKKLLWAVLQLIRRSRVLIASKPKFILSFFKLLPLCEVKHITASPMWVSPSDWEDALKFVSDDSSNRRILVISDFDVAIQEAYLIPGLISFLNSTPNASNRILLVPSKLDKTAVCQRLWEFCVHFDVADTWFAVTTRPVPRQEAFLWESFPKTVQREIVLGFPRR